MLRFIRMDHGHAVHDALSDIDALVAVLVAAAGSFAGVYLSFFIDSAPAPTIVMTLAAVFVAALLWSGFRRSPVDPALEPAARRG